MKLIALVLLITLGLVIISPLSYAYALSDKKALKKIDREIKDIPGKVEDIDSIIAFKDDQSYVVWGDDIVVPPLKEICGDGLDNDLDGQIDEDCAPVEICGDGIDNDLDGQIDEGCIVDEICGDGIDNNGNGLIDENCTEICGDGIDNNGNGQIDENCPVQEICGDGIDNDLDGLIDEDCVEICGDGIDNNNNGQIDENCPTDGFQVLSNKTTEFVAGGDWGASSDTQDNIDNIKSIAKGSEFLLGLGDYYYDSSASTWKTKYMDVLPYGKHFSQGNHDSDGYYSTTGQSGWNTKSTVKNMQVFDINSEASLTGQAEKLSSAFSGNPAGIFEVVIMHEDPITMKSSHGATTELQGVICDAKKTSDVDLILAGHNHNYQQSKLLKCDANGKFVLATDSNDPANFVFFIVGGGGRDLYSISGTDPLFSQSSKSFGVLDIQINNDTALTQYIKSDKTIQFPFLWKYN